MVVATRNRRSSLLDTLRHLTGPAMGQPVIVVDNGSTDGTPDAVREAFPGVGVIEAGANLGAAGRTLGVVGASTPYVAFSDDDSWWEPGALEVAAAALDACPRLALVAARVEVGPERVPDPTSQAMASSPLPRAADLPGPSVLGFMACGAVVRREAYLRTGGFSDLLFFYGEECMVALDLAEDGWGLAYLDEVVARHHPAPSRDDAARRRLATRNDLLTTWMRRRVSSAVGTTARVVVSSSDSAVRGGFFDALAALPAALGRRRVIGVELDRQMRLLEKSVKGDGREPGLKGGTMKA